MSRVGFHRRDGSSVLADADTDTDTDADAEHVQYMQWRTTTLIH